ncbi:hypothetical protein HUT18_11160 [Streptomyces sp. NA04227]|uniref:hypothetical protein n=1 Tax=Streptomyces sp. NA04227 TaxID=2742136 RepID=UPI001591117E|nr:hypothetical protein [Streptomyces sp. NA04227]QKW06867.1 hypothetical protein HUT18_11160 [Streptomyces sp. NA04227]
MRSSSRATRIALTVGFTAGLLAAVPAVAVADAEPAYTCNVTLPSKPAHPPVVDGADCTPSQGAPASGPVEGPVHIILNQPGSPLPADSDGKTRVICKTATLHADAVKSVDGNDAKNRIKGEDCELADD